MGDFRLIASWVAEAMRGTLTGDGAREFTGVSIDTRTLKPGELFIAIRGERFDGVEFTDAAIAAGAAGVVVPRGTTRRRNADSASPLGERASVIEVDETTAALQALARAIRRESGTKVVAITGSAGKTTTKEAASELLSTRYRVAEPEVRVWTNVGDAHVGFFASVEAIADAKAEIFEGARASDLLVA